MTQNNSDNPVTLMVGNRIIDITDELVSPPFSYGFVKPHVFGRYEEILADVERFSVLRNAPLNVLQSKTYRMSRDVAEQHYAVHRDSPFFNQLIDMITEGPSQHFVVHSVNPGDNAIGGLRTVCGATDSRNAEENTIRRKYGEPAKSIMYNAIHASDSLGTFVDEVQLHFERSELGDFFWDRLEAYKKYLDSLRQP